jgi:Protein of unknown function (DUF3050)
MDPLARLHNRLAPLKAALLDHPVYQAIDSLPALHVFMEHHVFAVWDFMSLLKTLQQHLACVDVPWLPGDNRLGCRFINEIVLAEESDEDGQGAFCSHFELYRRAMKQSGASTLGINGLLAVLRQGQPLADALASAEVAPAARSFVQTTFEIIDAGNLCAIASAFTFGREDLLPALFQRIVDELNLQTGGGLELFRYYLNRHIGLDGDEHGPMAGRLMQSLCGSDESLWTIAEQTATKSLEARRALWDGIYGAMNSRKAGEHIASSQTSR